MPPARSPSDAYTPQYGPLNRLADLVRPGPTQSTAACKRPVKRFALGSKTQIVYDLCIAGLIAAISLLVTEMWQPLGKSPVAVAIDFAWWLDDRLGYFAVPIALGALAAIGIYAMDEQGKKRLHANLRRRNQNARHSADKATNRPTLRAIAVVEKNFSGASPDDLRKPLWWLRSTRRCIAFALSWSVMVYALPVGLTIAMIAYGMALLATYRTASPAPEQTGNSNGVIAAAHSLFVLRRCVIGGYGTYLVLCFLV